MQNVIDFSAHLHRLEKESDKIGSLPFVKHVARPKRGKPPRCFWSVPEATGRLCDLADEQRLGSEYALLALAVIAATDFTPLLGLIVWDMIDAPGKTKNVITGFMQTISEAAAANT